MTTQAPHEPFPSDSWTPTPPPKHRRRWPWIVLAVIAVLVVGGIAINATKPPTNAAAQAAAAAPVTKTVPTTVSVTVTAAAPAPVTVTAAAPAPLTVTAAAAAPATVTAAAPAAAPGTVPKDGTSLVGTGVQPGTYSSSRPGCYWERLSDTSGSFDGIIANDFSDSGNTVVTISESDVAFKSQGCAPWTAVG